LRNVQSFELPPPHVAVAFLGRRVALSSGSFSFRRTVALLLLWLLLSS